MSIQQRHKTLLLIICTIFGLHVQSQVADYHYPYQNQYQQKSAFHFEQITTENVQAYFTNLGYENLKVELDFIKKSLGSSHYAFTIFYQNIPIQDALVKINRLHQSGEIQLIQSNLPSPTVWNQFFAFEHQFTKPIGLIINEQLIIVEQKMHQIEERDEYKWIWSNDDGIYFERELKYHNDTTMHVKVFNPDPITSATTTYGGNFVDALTIDTSTLVIQNQANNNNSTITFNAANYNFDGQIFNVATESYVNNLNGSSIFQYFTEIIISGQGAIQGFNTAITDNVSSVNTTIIYEDFNYPNLAAEQVWKTIQTTYTAGEFQLANDYFVITEFSLPFTNPPSSTIDTFDFNRSEIAFEDVNAFYHLDQMKDYWISLGFTDLADEVIIVDAHGNNGADNSFFSPTSPPRLVFGQGGVDDAEDADVVVHEYGHGISHFAAPNTNVSDSRRALDEGFGDYLAISYSKKINPFNYFQVFSWDGHNEFWNGRVSNSTKTRADYSTAQNIYYNGEIWSAVLADLNDLLGATVADQLAIEVMFYNTTNTTFDQAAVNLFYADTALFNGQYSCQIFTVLENRAFVSGTCEDYEVGVKEISSINGIQIINSYGFSNHNEALQILWDDAIVFQSAILIDEIGRKVAEFELRNSELKVESDGLDSGVYFLQLLYQNENYSLKLLKK